MNGLSLSREYFNDVALPSFRESFPDEFSRAAAGLVGNGSECFGYDDEVSRDHDWGVDFFIWLSESDRDAIQRVSDWKLRLLREHPPEYPRTQSEYGARVGVMTSGDFYRSLVGFPNGPQTINDWRVVPEENLAMAVNGETFIDNSGEFTATREYLLKFYPEALRLKRISYQCMALAQTGQYNYERISKRNDVVTMRSVLSRFSDSVIAMVFLLNRTYRPYYKWAFRAMCDLPILSDDAADCLKYLATTTDGVPEIRERMYGMCDKIAAQLRAEGLSDDPDWFLTTHAESVRAKISDDFLRSLPTQYEI
jgi:hypothetical protein